MPGPGRLAAGWAALVLAPLLGLCPAPALSQQLDAQPPAIAAAPGAVNAAVLTLDQDRLYAESLYGKALERKSADAVAQLAAQNRQIESDLSAEEKALTDQRASLSAEAFKPLAEAFDAKVERIRAEQEAKSKSLTDARDAGRKHFFETALPILADLMRQRGALAILNKSAVILSFDAIDITDAAIALVDEKLGEGGAGTSP